MEWNQPAEGLADGLTCEALHLDVEELSEVAEPFNHLGGHAAVKLDSREEKLIRMKELVASVLWWVPPTFTSGK